MNRRLFILPVSAATIVLAFWLTQRSDEPARALPKVELYRLDGQIDHLADWRGKTVVLNVWATWCAPCRKEMPSLQKLSLDLDQDRYAVLGVSVDDNPILVREFLRENKITFAKHIDQGRRTTRNILGIESLPQTLIIDASGMLRKQVVGVREWHNVNIESLISE